METARFARLGVGSDVRQLFLSPTVRTISAVSGGNLLAAAIALVGTLVQSRVVGPDDLGYFRQFGIVTSYAFILQLGISSALQRLYPLYRGQGRIDKAVAVAQISESWNLGITGAVSSGFLLLAAVAFVQANWRAGLAWLAQAILIAGTFYGGHLTSTYLSGHDFRRVARGNLLSSLTSLLTLPFFIVAPYLALALRSSLGSLVALSYLHVGRPLRLAWRFSGGEWLAVARQGIWLHTAYYGTGPGKLAVEGTMVVSWLGTTALGLWAASYSVLEVVNKVAQAISAVYIPRVVEEYGRTGSMAACLRMCKRPVLWALVPVSVMGAGTCAVLPFIVPWLIPKYAAAIPTMCLLMITLPLIILEMPYHLVFAKGDPVWINVVSYGSLGCFAVLGLLAVRLELGLNGIIGASLLSHGARVGMTYALVTFEIRRERSGTGARGPQAEDTGNL